MTAQVSMMSGKRRCHPCPTSPSGEEHATRGAGTHGRTGVQAAPGVHQAEAGERAGVQPPAVRRRCVCARAARQGGSWGGVHGGDACVGGRLRLCRWQEARGVPGVAPVWSWGARESRHHLCMSLGACRVHPWAVGAGVHSMAGVQGVGRPSGTCTGGLCCLPSRGGWIGICDPFPRTRVFQQDSACPSQSRGGDITPCAYQYITERETEAWSHPQYGGQGCVPRSLLETSTPSAGAILGSLTQGFGVQEAAHWPQ